MTHVSQETRKDEEARGKWKKHGEGFIEKSNVLSSHEKSEGLMKTDYIAVCHLDKLLQ